MKFVSGIQWIDFSLFESSSWLLKGLWVGFSKARSMCVVHKRILFHTVFIYLLKSLHWRTTGVERVLCYASSIHCEYWPRIWRSSIHDHRLATSWSCVHVCMSCTWTRIGILGDSAYRLMHELGLDQNTILTFLVWSDVNFASLLRAPQIGFWSSWFAESFPSTEILQSIGFITSP